MPGSPALTREETVKKLINPRLTCRTLLMNEDKTGEVTPVVQASRQLPSRGQVLTGGISIEVRVGWLAKRNY
jgi:hypothetical protein